MRLDSVDAGGNPTTRVVEHLTGTGALLIAWCHLRQDERSVDPPGMLAVRAC